jgi:hypothetical protein
MKEASGELSMTAVAVVAIAAIGVVFTTLIWPSLKSNIVSKLHCSEAFNCVSTGTGTQMKCQYCSDETCKTTEDVYCAAASSNDK